MIVWLLSRPDQEEQAQCLKLLENAALSSGARPGEIHWRILPSSRMWVECVELVKNEHYPASEYPALIEYPLVWQDSLEFLNLLATMEDVAKEEDRWSDLAGKIRQDNLASSVNLVPGAAAVSIDGNGDGRLLSFSWLVGLTALFYRKDMLHLMNRAPADLNDYESWITSVFAISQSGRYKGLEMPLTFISALWWIFSFGGDFFDPLNLMPAFHQAEALRAIEAMILTLSSSAKAANREESAGFERRFFGDLSISQATIFPERAFCRISTFVPRAVIQGDPRVVSALPPKVNDRTVIAHEYILGVTRRGLETAGDQILGTVESWLSDASLWTRAALLLGSLPAKTAIWGGYFDAIADPSVREIYHEGLSHARWALRSPYLAPTIRAYEEALARLYLSAMREGFIDTMKVASGVARAASEYRLISAMYGAHGEPSRIVSL
ncbi:MAG: hypothetical protein HY547_10475 [Elusimicrobia bacterium]|nr:hypothetical protein [Elusimicrobiota bacterium]